MVRARLLSRQYIYPTGSQSFPPSDLISADAPPPKETFRTFEGTRLRPLALHPRLICGPLATHLRPKWEDIQMGGYFSEQNMSEILRNTI